MDFLQSPFALDFSPSFWHHQFREESQVVDRECKEGDEMVEGDLMMEVEVEVDFLERFEVYPQSSHHHDPKSLFLSYQP